MKKVSLLIIPDFSSIKIVYNKIMPSLTIAIPTYNAGPHLDHLLTQLKRLPPLDKNFFLIDSSSTDQTQTIIKKHRLPHLVIPQSQFSHSATRNLFLQQLNTPFVYFCTQDILPATSKLFSILLQSLNQHPSAVTAFGPQLTYPQTPLFFKIETELIYRQLNLINNSRPIVQTRTNLPRNNPFLWHFLSNNNALYRTAFLRRHPFPQVPYGEDTALGQFIIQNGFAKIYHPQAKIFHSHTYSLTEYARRQRQEFRLYATAKTYRRPTFLIKTKTILTASTSFKNKTKALFFLFATYLIKLKLLIQTKLNRL